MYECVRRKVGIKKERKEELRKKRKEERAEEGKDQHILNCSQHTLLRIAVSRTLTVQSVQVDIVCMMSTKWWPWESRSRIHERTISLSCLGMSSQT